MIIIFEKFIQPINGTLTGTTTFGQRGPGSNDNERVTTHFSELEPHHQMQFSVVPSMHLLLGGGGSYFSVS